MSYFPERRFPRLEFQQVPWVFSLRLPEPAAADKPLRLEARNISRGGTKFLCNRRFNLFEVMQFQIFEKTSGKALQSLKGKVVRVEEIDTGYGERTFGIAIEFAADTTEQLGALLPDSRAPSPGK